MQEISQHAVHLFSRDGFKNVRVEDIAAAAGVSVRTFHRYFAAKAAAAEPALRSSADVFLAALDAAGPGDITVEDVLDAYGAALSDPAAADQRTALLGAQREPALELVWLGVLDRVRRDLTHLLTDRWPTRPEDHRVEFVAAVVIDALWIPVEQMPGASVAELVSTAGELLRSVNLPFHA